MIEGSIDKVALGQTLGPGLEISVLCFEEFTPATSSCKISIHITQSPSSYFLWQFLYIAHGIPEGRRVTYGGQT